MLAKLYVTLVFFSSLFTDRVNTLHCRYSNTLLATLNARIVLRTSSQSSQQYVDARKTLLWDDEPGPFPTPRVSRNYVPGFTSGGSQQGDTILLEVMRYLSYTFLCLS